MIRHKNINNVEYCQIKTITLFGLDRKSQIKINNHLAFLFFNVKYSRCPKSGLTSVQILDTKSPNLGKNWDFCASPDHFLILNDQKCTQLLLYTNGLGGI